MPEPTRYQITLLNNRIRNYHRFAWIMGFLAVTMAVLYAVANNRAWYWPAALALFMIITLAGLIPRNPAEHRRKTLTAVVYSLLITLWACWQQYPVALILVLFLFLYLVSVRPFTVTVSGEGIRFPFFPVKKIAWEELSNMVLKDGILTLDLASNKLLQVPVLENSGVNEKEFNEFCSRQLNKGR